MYTPQVRMTSVFQFIIQGCAFTKFAKSICHQRHGLAEGECEIQHTFSLEHSLPVLFSMAMTRK